MSNFNQELSIKSNKEFAKENVDKAWTMQTKSNTLVNGVTKEKWAALQVEINIEKEIINKEVINEEKLHERNYPSFNKK